MRLWSIHPRYLDKSGLVALWREALLAKHVLEGKTKGYRHHPQLVRFKDCPHPLNAINFFLHHVYLEACSRGYCFDKTKVGFFDETMQITVSTGQIAYEWKHLLDKLKLRDLPKYHENVKVKKVHPHPLFKVVKGDIEAWERLK